MRFCVILFESLCDRDMVHEVHVECQPAPNRVCLKMNSFVIAVGSRVKPRHDRAKDEAKKVGTVTADMGDTECKTPSSTESIERVAASGRAGQQHKHIRC